MQEQVVLPTGPAAARAARRAVRERLHAWDLEALEDAAVLLTTELVTNAVLHTTGEVVLVLRQDGGGVRVEVSDDSPVVPVQRRFSAESTTGRGLRLVEELARDWGVRARPGGGKAVWFLLCVDDA